MPYSRALIGVVLGLVLVSCAAPSGQGQPPAASREQATQNRTLVLAHRFEVRSLAPKVLQTNGPLSTTRLFNATLSLIDDQGISRPYLAEALPQLNTDTWRVAPDGHMEITYRLRENLTWQDGTPLTAEDFVLAYRVYTDPGLGVFSAFPQNAIDAVLAPDPRTVLVQWRSLNANAGDLTFGDLDPLPSHLIEAAFADYTTGRASGEAFLGSPVWTTAYIGAGPYRLERWDPGVQLEGTAFDRHVLGRPRIERIIVRYFTDENATLAAVLAGGQVDYTERNTMRFNQLVVLKQQWEAEGKGTAVVLLSTAVFPFLQQRPEYVGDRGLLDVRVRRAIAHAIDRDAINHGIYDGLGAPTESPVPPNVPFYPEVERLTTKYPLDVNRSSQLMSDAGYRKDGEGFFVDGSGNRFHLDFAVFDSSELERMQTILSDSWRRAGFDVRTVVMASTRFTQPETRQTLPGLAYALFPGERAFLSSEIGTPANRWSGANRSGWISPEYDRLYEAWDSTLDATERGRYVAQLMALISENLPGYSLYFPQVVNSWVASLQGATAARETSGFGQSSRATTNYWNIYEWSFR
jgi:peptide/nickel transport system substrate-binding protein